MTPNFRLKPARRQPEECIRERSIHSGIAPGIAPSRRQVTPFVHTTISSRFDAARRKPLDGRADAALAALEPVIDCGIDHIDPLSTAATAAAA